MKKGLILQAGDCESDKRSDKRHFHAVGNDGDIDDKPSRLLSPMSHRRPRQSRQMSLTSLMSLEGLPCVRLELVTNEGRGIKPAEIHNQRKDEP